MSTNVAKALGLLGKNVTWVGADDRHPPRGASDAEIALFAGRTGAYIFTHNFDMVMATADAGARFIWFDGRGRALTMFDTAAMIFRQWDAWETELGTGGAECLKVGRRTVHAMSASEGRERAAARYDRQQKVARDLSKRPAPSERLEFQD